MNRKVEKEWDRLSPEEKSQTAQKLKVDLINSCLIPSNTSITSILAFLENEKQKVVFHFPNGKETVLGLNKDFRLGMRIAFHKRLYKETGNFYHKDYLVEIPDVVGIDEIFNSKKSN